MTDWFTTTGSREVHTGHVTLRIDTVTTPDGTVEREVAVPPDAVAVVAVLDGDVVLVRQHRQPIGATTLELPAGVLDHDGEGVLEAGARELAEECHLAADHLEELVTVATSPGWTTERVTLLHARGVHRTDPPDGFEATAEEAAMEVVRLPLEAAVTAVRDGTISDAKTALGILLVADRVADGVADRT